MAHGGLVHGEEGAGLRILHPHRLRIVLEADAVAFLGGAQGVEHAHPLRHLAGQEQRCLLAVILHGARAHLEHRVHIATVQDRLESAPSRDRRARDAGIGPEAVDRGPQHPLAREGKQLARARIGVLDDARARVDDDQGFGDALEQVAISALDLAQHLLRWLLLDHAPELRAGAGDA